MTARNRASVYLLILVFLGLLISPPQPAIASEIIEGDFFFNTDTGALASYLYEASGGEVIIPGAVREGDYQIDPVTGAIVHYSGSEGTVVIPNKVAGITVQSIGNFAFTNCNTIANVTIPSGVTSIGINSFSVCPLLVSVTIPNSVTVIDQSAFSDCESLTSINIPDSVSTVRDYAFSRCINLSSVVFEGDAPASFGKDVFLEPAPSFSVEYYAGATGFTTPTWNGYPCRPIGESSPPADTPPANTTPVNTTPPSDSDIGATVDGVAITFPDQQPFADENSRVLVPIRYPMEAMGVNVEWIQSSQQAILTKGAKTAIFTIGSRNYTIDGIQYTMDTVPIALNGRTLFPIRYAVEAFGGTVQWDANTKTVIITAGDADNTDNTDSSNPDANNTGNNNNADNSSPDSNTPEDTISGPEILIFELENFSGVQNGPPNKTIVEVTAPTTITKIATYHWNNGQGEPAGSISLRDFSTDAIIGTWSAIGADVMFDLTPGAVWPTTSTAQPHLYWVIQPNVTVPAGWYEIVDSSDATWSYNAESQNMGFARVFGIQ